MSHTANFAWVMSAEVLVAFCEKLRGILVGCPAAGFVFVVCIDPILRAMSMHTRQNPDGIFNNISKYAERNSLTRACADDLASVLERLKFLKVSEPVFRVAAKISGMGPNLKKCNILP